MHTCVFTCVRLYTNTEIRTGAACLHCNWLTRSQFTYSMCQLGRLPWPLKNDTQMIHSVLLGFKHLAAVKYLPAFSKETSRKTVWHFHISSSCCIPSYGVMWICHMVSCGFVLDQVWVPLLSYGVMWSQVGARRRFSSLWSDWKSKKYCGDGHPRVSESG